MVFYAAFIRSLSHFPRTCIYLYKDCRHVTAVLNSTQNLPKTPITKTPSIISLGSLTRRRHSQEISTCRWTPPPSLPPLVTNSMRSHAGEKSLPKTFLEIMVKIRTKSSNLKTWRGRILENPKTSHIDSHRILKHLKEGERVGGI